MWGEIKSLSKQTVIYGGGMIAKRALGFLMIPLYTRYLRPADYGQMEILDLTGFVVAFFIGFGLLYAVFRFHSSAADDAGRRQVKTNAILGVAVLGGAVTILFLAASAWISKIGLGDDRAAPLVVLVLGGVYFGQLFELLMGYLRAENKAFSYVAISLASSLVGLTLNIVLLVFLGMGVRGIFLSGLISMASFAVALLALRIPGGGWKPRPRLLRQMLAYCLPFMPMGLMAFVVNFSDRYFLRVYTDMQTVGIYALGYKFGLMVGFLIGTPFQLVWSAQAFEIAKAANAQKTYARLLTYYAGALLAMSCLLAAMSREIVTVVATPDYAAAASVIGLVAWGAVFLNLTDMVQVGIMITKRTFWLPILWGITMVANVAMNFLLIPRWGMMGAAWSTLLSFALQAAMTMVVSESLYPIRYEWGRVALLGAIALAGTMLDRILPVLSVYASVVVKSVILLGMALFPLTVPGFVTEDERAVVAGLRARLAIGRRREP